MKNLTLLLLCVFSTYAWADKTKLYYAGFAFIGDSSKIDTNYPMSSKLSKQKDDKGLFILEKELRTRIEKIKSDKVDLSMELGNTKKGSSMTVAFAVDWENVALEKIAEVYKFIVTVNAQMLVFDFNEKKIIASFPVSMDVIDVKEAKLFTTKDGKEPSKEELKNTKLYADTIESIVNSIYTNGDATKNIFDVFVKKLSTVDIKEKYGYRIKVNDVTFEDKALETFKELNVDKMSAKNFIANNFVKFLSTNQQVSILPYSTGDVIGRKMSARFMNGDVYNLEIPNSDYDVDLKVRGFKKVEFDRTAAEVGLAFGAYLSVKVSQPDLKKVYMDAEFTGKGMKVVSLAQLSTDDWSAYQETMISFFNDFTMQITKQEDKWLKGSSKVDTKELKTQFKQLSDLLQKCK